MRIDKRPEIFGNGIEETEIDTSSRQFGIEIQKLIKEAFQTSHLKSPEWDGLFSESIMTKSLMDILPFIIDSKSNIFLERHLPGNQKELLREALEREFPTVRDGLFQLETKKEMETLEGKFNLIGKVLEKGIFDVGMEKGSVRLLFQALGVKYHNNQLSFANSNRHTVPVRLGNLPFPKAMEQYVSTGFVHQNHSVLELLAEKNSENSPKLTASAFFLPMIFPKLYERMNPVYHKQYENVALSSYVKYAERMHAPYEKSPKDYIAFFNAKGFYFTRTENGFEVKSIYTDKGTSCTLSKRTGSYLHSIPNLSKTLNEQHIVINGLVKDCRDHLKNLWAGHLMEKGRYDKVAFMLTYEKSYPNLHPEMVHHHMDNGLRKSVGEAIKRQFNIQQNRLLRKGVYAISSLLDNRGKGQEEVYNGFKDKLTDYSKYKGNSLWL